MCKTKFFKCCFQSIDWVFFTTTLNFSFWTGDNEPRYQVIIVISFCDINIIEFNLLCFFGNVAVVVQMKEKKIGQNPTINHIDS